MDNLSETMSSVWREVSREARTSLGRRRSSASASNRPIVKPPPGAHGLTTHEDEGGWDVVERTSTERKEVRETHTALPARAIIFLPNPNASQSLSRALGRCVRRSSSLRYR